MKKLQKQDYGRFIEKYPCLKGLSLHSFKRMCSNQRRQTTIRNEQNHQREADQQIVQRAKRISIEAELFDCHDKLTVYAEARLKQQITSLKDQLSEAAFESLQLFSSLKMKPSEVQEAHTTILSLQKKELMSLYRQSIVQPHLELQSQQFVLLKPIDKVFTFLNQNQSEELEEGSLHHVCHEMEEQLSLMQPDELQDIPRFTKVGALISRFLDKQLFGQPPLVSVNFLILMLQQNCLRKCLLQYLELEAAEKRHNSREVDGPYTAAIKDMMRSNPLRSEFEEKLVFGNIEKFIWDELLMLISSSDLSNSIVYQVENCKQNTENPWPLVKKIYLLCERIDWIWMEILEKHEQVRGITLEGVVSTLQLMKEWHQPRILQAVREHKFLGIRSGLSASVQTASVIQQKDRNAMDEAVANIIGDGPLREYYDLVHSISLAWVEVAEGWYDHRSIACYIAAKQAFNLKKCVYSQVNQGNGKTFINLLTFSLLEDCDLKPVYVCANAWLKEAVEQVAARVGLKNFQAHEFCKLDDFLNGGFVFIVDEYHRALVTTKLEYSKQKRLNAIFAMGLTEKAILSTGHDSPQMTKFLMQYLGSGNIDFQINKPLLEMAGREQEYRVNVTATEVGKCQESALRYVTQMAQLKPVITFGLSWEPGSMFGLPEDSFIELIDENIEALRRVQSTARTTDKGVLGLPFAFSFGVDIRFMQDAHVVICAPRPPSVEDTRQMIARGVRSLATQEGTVFFEGSSRDADYYQQTLQGHDGDDFQDAVAVLRALQELITQNRSDRTVEAIIKGGRQQWMISSAGFLETQNKQTEVSRRNY